MGNIPAISGKKLIKLLESNGWTNCGRCTHGIALKKAVGKEILITTVPDKSDPLPPSTLHAILSVKQTRLGSNGLRHLLGIPQKKKKKKS